MSNQPHPGIGNEAATSRRRFILSLSGLFVFGLAHAQKPDQVRKVGILIGGGAADKLSQAQLSAIVDGLRQLGWATGRNVEIDSHWGDGNLNAMRSSAQALMIRKPDVIGVSTATALREVRKVAGQIPIVFWGVSDPRGNGFVDNLARPEGNLTGFSLFEYAMGGKWLQLVKQVAPNTSRVLVLQHDKNPNRPQWIKALDAVAPSLGLELVRANIGDVGDIEPAISRFAAVGKGAMVSLPDPFLTANRELIVNLCRKLRLPSVYGLGAYAQAGGLLSYGVDNIALTKRAAEYVSRILNGEKVGNLPVQAPTRFELVVNMKTAKALGLRIPPDVLVAADQVIE